MSEFLSYNPDRGTWVETDYSAHEDKLYIHTKQDVSPALDLAMDERNSGLNDKVGDWNKYATIPAHVELEMRRKYGVNIYDPGHTKRLLKLLNGPYKYLKTTNLKHEVKHD
jgi:hypothetical protein